MSTGHQKFRDFLMRDLSTLVLNRIHHWCMKKGSWCDGDHQKCWAIRDPMPPGHHWLATSIPLLMFVLRLVFCASRRNFIEITLRYSRSETRFGTSMIWLYFKIWLRQMCGHVDLCSRRQTEALRMKSGLSWKTVGHSIRAIDRTWQPSCLESDLSSRDPLADSSNMEY